MTVTDRATWTLEEIPQLRGYCVEWAATDELILSRRDELLVTAGLTAPRRSLGRVASTPWRSLASRLRPLQRALRFLFYNVVRLPDGRLFFTFDRRVGLWDQDRDRPVEGVSRPARVLRGACAVDRRGDVYFGEYLGNPQRHDVHVYRLPLGENRVRIAHTFPPGEVRHVHGIYADAHDDSLWCVTGDRPSECRMLRTADGFQTLQTVGGGDETWRCVSLLFTPRGAYYGSDAEFIPNYLYFVDRRTGQRARLSPIDGPVYYSRAAGDDLFFGVTAELCPSQAGRFGSLWQLRDGEAGRQVMTVAKDAWPVRYFQAGTWQFPRGPGHGEHLLVHLVGLRGDNRTYRLTRAAA